MCIKTLIIGLDGATWEILIPLINDEFFKRMENEFREMFEKNFEIYVDIKFYKN